MQLSRSHIVFWLALLLIIFVSGGDLYSQTILSPDASSRLWIEGRSNINQFICDAEQYSGRAEVRHEDNQTNLFDVSDEHITLLLHIPVESFECGRNRMNQDLKQALKSDQFPYITFEFKEAETLTEATSEFSSHKIEVKGILTVAGVSREISVSTDGSFISPGRVRAQGQKTILMTDYNVEPPTGLFGLIKAEDQLTVHFDLYSTLPGENQDRGTGSQ